MLGVPMACEVLRIEKAPIAFGAAVRTIILVVDLLVFSTRSKWVSIFPKRDYADTLTLTDLAG